ncbi:MAG TPA: fructosamine kinase [Bacillus bacterium]|uniref:fructosamine kinase family protein n=1 Tax=Siminovitchia fordii TaxID=254759 RepID=UPI00037BF79F|nr:fructosamine kinase family protein [Siminovitchia fordii]HBZ08884.1 fructosamine kinase [Bacillus sp. (in: firmicutes)]
MNQIIRQSLYKADDRSSIKNVKRVAGGSINESFFVETERSKYFIKYHANSPSGFFELEADGLRLIKSTKSISVPDVLAFSDKKGEAFLVMEWLEGCETSKTQIQLGEQLAAMHQNYGIKHGFRKDTFIGTLPQPNGLSSSWLDYYRDKRLKAQLEQGIQQQTIKGKRRDRLEKLLEQLEDWIPDEAPPSYLHGDLWGGNWLPGPDGNPYLIDPSFLYGDRHFELAFTELFGGFTSAFYEAYASRFPIADYYEEIKPLYQLYYLIVHLNIFSEMYGGKVDSVLKRYV